MDAIGNKMNIATAGGAGAAAATPGVAKSSTDPQFGQIFEQIQAKYGAKAEKPKEIKKTLGKDDFLKIMVTQMKFQDPTNPFKPEQMAAEMAQFASVEQLQNINSAMTRMSDKNQPLERLAMTNMIGKTVTVSRDRFPHTEGQNSPVSFKLPRDAADVKIAIVNEAGETVYEKDLGSQKAGDNTVTWDGRKLNTLPAKSGQYTLKIQATDERGQFINTDTATKAQVIGVSFEGSEPVFLVGNAQHQDKVTLKNIVKIEEGALMPAGAMMPAPVGGAASAGAASAANQPNGMPNFIAFKKGEGSSNLTSDMMTPEVVEAINRFQAQQAAAKPADAAGLTKEADTEKGFPNGLHDSDEPNTADLKGGES